MKSSALSILKISAAPFALGLAMISSVATAQQAPAEAAPDAETIVVTGSRIARTEISSSIPVAVVSANTIKDAGHTNVLDALRDLPISGQSAGTTASNFSNSGNGEALVNLRNLGSARTLVLINGRRSTGIPGSSAVDLNNIPTDLIDHVEIATGGASAVYGSDAVAGVVNIILKNKFKGLELHAQQSVTGQGDGASPLLSALGGLEFAGGAGHIVANISYTQQNAVASSARDYSAKDSPTGSSYTPTGLFAPVGLDSPFSGDGSTFTLDANNTPVPYTGAQSQRFNRAALRLLSIPVKRLTGSLLASYEFSPAAEVYAEFTYSKTKANGRIEPLAADDAGVQGGTVYNFDGSAFPGIASDNPYMPAAIAAAAGPDSFVNFRKRWTGIFDRSPYDDRDYYRGVIGVKGSIGTNWKYDLSYEHSQVRDDTTNGAIMMNNFGASLQATTIGGQVVCSDPVARAAGCVPINIFGRQPYTAAQLKWLSTYTGQGAVVPGATVGQTVVSDFLQKNTQDVVTAAVTGSLFKLPNGPLGVAAGVEYHHEKVSAFYDPFTKSGWSSQQSNGDETGKYDSKEAFLELNAPIFGGVPGIYAITLEGAARYSDYSTAGKVWSYKFGGTYAPTSDLRFRAIYARAVRAPNLNELYSPQANTAQQVVDPCDQNAGLGETVPTPQRALPAGCQAIPGIGTYLQTHPNFAYSLAQVQTINGLVGGNPNLKAEATNTFTAGMTFQPRFLRNSFLTVDYYTIKVKNAVATVDPQTAVDQCFATGSADFCNYITRNANGFITRVDGVSINAASYLVAGLDLHGGYAFNTTIFRPDEKITLDVFYNHKFKQQQTPFAGGPISNELGAADTYASQQLGTGFKDQFAVNANYATGPLTLHYRLKYYGPVSASSGSYQIPAYTYHDLQAKLGIGEDQRFEFYVGCNNVLDKQPPFIAGGNSQWPGTNTVADTYDLLGRTFYAGVSAKF